MASTYELIVKAVDQTKTPLRNIERNLQGLDKKAKGVGISMRGVGAAIAAFATGATVKSIVNTTARFEDLNDTLTSVTGSAESGAKAFAGIQSFATRTQFGVEELTNTYIKLAGAGIKPTEKLLTTFTDTAAVTTDQLGTLTAITDLFSRTTSGGLGLEELNRLADRGVPVFKILEEQLGLTRLEISEFGKTADGANKITEALQRGLNQRFGGATQNKMDNLSTAMSNFGIAVTNAADRLGSKFRPQLTAAIADATKFLEQNNKLIDALGDGLGTAITNTSKALGVIAQNFDAIKNAALILIGLRIASFFGNLASRLSSAIAGAKTFGGIFGGMSKAIAGTAARIPILGAAFAGLASIATRLGPLLLNPFVGIPVAVAAAVTGGLIYFQDSLVTVGETTASLGEVTQAIWTLIKGYVLDAANFIGEKMFNAYKSIKGWFADLPKLLGVNFETIGNYAQNAGNFILNSFVAAFEAIVGIAKNIPSFFKASFQAILNLAGNLASKLTSSFSLLGEAIGLALARDFEGATAKVFEAMELNLGDAFKSAFDDVPSLIPEINYDEIFKTDRLGQTTDFISSQFGALRIEISKFFGDTFDPIIDKIEQTVIANRALQQSTSEVTTKIEEQTSSIDDVNLGLSETATVTQEVAEKTLTYADFLKDLIKSSYEDAQLTQFQARAKADLDAQLAAGVITLDAYAAAMDRLGVSQRKELTVVEQMAKNIKDNNKELAAYQDALANASVVAKQLGVDEAQLTEELKKRIEQMTKTGEKTKEVTDLIKDRFKSAGDSMADSLARGLARGEMSLNNFKDIFNRFLEDIAAAIIQKNITQPLVNQIVGFSSSLIPGGGAQPQAGGGFSFDSIISGIGDFFGGFFADGGPVSTNKGYVVGERGPELFMPRTAGDIISNEAMNGGGEGATVNFNINAISTRDGVEFLLENKPQIISMVTQAQNQRGRQGITA